jgi:hypothetical protein
VLLAELPRQRGGLGHSGMRLSAEDVDFDALAAGAEHQDQDQAGFLSNGPG